MGIFQAIHNGFNNIFKFAALTLSENGSPSSTRFLMVLFSFATVRVIFIVVHHLVALTDSGILSIWLGNLPLLITSLIGLIATPYAINRGTASLSSIANMVIGAKSGTQITDPTPPVTKTDSVTVATTTTTPSPSSQSNTVAAPLQRSK
jgi:hypothetical protein